MFRDHVPAGLTFIQENEQMQDLRYDPVNMGVPAKTHQS